MSDENESYINNKLGKKEINEEKKTLEEIVDKPMGDDDIKRIIPDAKIILYKDLKKYNNIDEILPHKKSYAIILYLSSPNSGHWTAIMKPNDSTIEYFDSYGGNIDKPLSWLTNEQNKNLGIEEPYLSNLLKKSKYNIIENNTQFQAKGKGNEDISTCGRHCCYRIQCMKNKNMNLEQYKKMMERVKNNINLNFDKLVGIMISDNHELKQI